MCFILSWAEHGWILCSYLKSRKFFFLAASAAKFWKHDTVSALEGAFPGVLPDFWLLNSLQKRCFSTQEFSHFWSTALLQRRATRSDCDVSFQTKRSECLVTATTIHTEKYSSSLKLDIYMFT